MLRNLITKALAIKRAGIAELPKSGDVKKLQELLQQSYQPPLKDLHFMMLFN